MTILKTISKDTGTKVIDPVCGMEVEPAKTKLVALYKGKSYWFCAPGCKDEFEANPVKYLDPKFAKKKGWFGKYLEKMARTNKKEFGCDGPRCH